MFRDVLGRSAIILFVCVLFVSLTSSQEYAGYDESYTSDVMEGLKIAGHRLTEVQVRMINDLQANNSASQRRVQVLEREVDQCNGKIEQNRIFHEKQLQRLTGEQKTAIDNCELRLQLAQLEANSASEKLALLQQLQQISREHITPSDPNDELVKCSKNLEQYRLHNINLQQRLEAKHNEIKNLRAENQSLLDAAQAKDRLITQLTDSGNLARVEIKRLTDVIKDLQTKTISDEERKKIASENNALKQDKLKLITDNEELKLNNIKLINQNTDLKKKISNLEADIRKLKQDIVERNKIEEESSSNLNGIINDLRNKNAETTNENNHLEAALNETVYNYKALLRDIARVEEEKSKLELEMEALVQEFLKYKKSCYKIKHWA